MNWKTLKENEGKIRTVALKGGREYTGKIISVSNNSNNDEVIVTIKDKFGAEVKLSGDDIIAIEEVLV